MNSSTANNTDNLKLIERIKVCKAHSAIITSFGGKVFHTFLFWPLLNRHLPDMTFSEGHCENPIARLVFLFLVIKLGFVVVIFFLLLAYIIDANHVAVTDKHEHAKVQNTCIEAEVFGYALVDCPSPSFNFLFNHCAKTYSVPPIVTNLSNLVHELAFLCVLCYGRLWIILYSISVHELQIELIEVSLNVYALKLWVEVLVDKDEVRVDLKATIFA